MGFVSFLVILILQDAIRLRESGMKVIEWEKKTLIPIVACDRFIYIEVLDGAIQKKAKNGQVLQTQNQLEKRLKSRLKSRLKIIK
jgi:benzoyl-CoA reductase/2-hydroxyglutaryl-CoA dehydratase subunit BcrC/BadD/HgdB